MSQAARRIATLLAVTFASVTLLFSLLYIMLFHVIGWHDGLILDWYQVYYPAVRAADPYAVWGYFNPPWLAWMLRPLGLLSAVESHALWITLVFLLTIRCVYTLGGDWLSVVLTIVSPGFLITIMNGQVDVLVLLGLLTGSWLLILIKPQVASLAILYDVIQERRIDWRSVALMVVSLALAAVFYSLPERAGLNMAADITPPLLIGLPVAVVLFWLAMRRRDVYLAAVASFFVAPYLSASSLLVYSAIGTSRYGRVAAVGVSVALWALGISWFL